MANEKKTITMLLDTDNFYGEHEGRLGPLLIFLAIASAPLLLYIAVNFVVPAWLFFPLYVIYVIRVAMITLGREKERLANFKKTINDEYSTIADLMSLKTIHEDGRVEYLNSRIGYMIVISNGSVVDDIARSRMVKEFFSIIGPEYDMDITAQNITETKALEERYKGVKLFVSSEAAQDFIDIIDYNRSLVTASSLITRTVIFVKGNKHDWKDIKAKVIAACSSPAARAFKSAHVASKEEVQEILSRDVNGYIDIEAIQQEKYATHEYFGSKVKYFDEPKYQKKVEKAEDTKSFIPRLS